MQFTETSIRGAYVIEPNRIEDERGYFGRIWCEKEFVDHGLTAKMVQSNVGYSRRRGTLRGLHLQRRPHQEIKVVRCTRGAMYDVIVDLRADSPSFKQYVGFDLTPDNGKMLYVPEGCAQGYLTLADETEMYYHTSDFYAPQVATGVRYDDPVFGIDWPIEVEVISEQDRNWPGFSGGTPEPRAKR